jgi:demethylmenaquinone methyltransferase/2-methoxy-6-polyprenyl-1,4-benzoquinol methylase
MTRADLRKEPAEIAAMFDGVAGRYDLVNDLLSLGQDRIWRKAVARAVAARPGERVLDLAAGTGTSSQSFAAGGAHCVACDFSLGMLRQGARKRGGADAGGVRLVAGDALALPFADARFDAVTISFGLRNLHDPAAGLAELLRVTRPGGRLVVAEFSSPTWAPFRTAYDAYLCHMPRLVSRVSSNPESYLYLAESIRAWPAQAELARVIAGAGWERIAWRNLTGGIVAVHRAVRPGHPT